MWHAYDGLGTGEDFLLCHGPRAHLDKVAQTYGVAAAHLQAQRSRYFLWSLSHDSDASGDSVTARKFSNMFMAI